MTIELNIENICNFISIVIGAYSGIYLILNKFGNRKANLFLGCFLFLISLSIFEGEIEYRVNSGWFNIFFVPFLSVYLSITILFYYSLVMTNRYKSEVKKYRWLFIPFVLEILFKCASFLLNQENKFLEIGTDLLLFLGYPFSLFIYVIILIQLKKHNNNILTLFSSIENKQLNWLKHLIMVNIGFMIIWIVDDSLRFTIGDNLISESISGVSLFATFITVIWIGFAGTKQPQIFEPSVEITPPKEEGLLPLEDENIFKEIKRKIESEKLFTNVNLSLKELASVLELRDKELSRIINQCYRDNFFHFINSYRVNYFKELMKDPENKKLSIVGLSVEAGFKSKSTFYTAFKKIEGNTPTTYKFD